MKSNNSKSIYLKDKGNIDIVFAKLAVSFEQWFNENYYQIKNELINKAVFDDDTMNQTYLELYDILMYRGITIKCYKSYFMKSYKYNLRALKKYESKINDIDLCEVEDNIEESADNHLNENKLLGIIDATLNNRESELIKMHIANSNLSIKSLAETIGIPRYTAYYIVKRAKIKLKEKDAILRIIN